MKRARPQKNTRDLATRASLGFSRPLGTGVIDMFALLRLNRIYMAFKADFQ